MRKKELDPRQFYRKLDQLFMKKPVSGENPNTLIPTMRFIYDNLKPYFPIINIYLYEKREQRYIHIAKLLKRKKDFYFPAIESELIDKFKLTLDKVHYAKDLEMSSESNYDLVFIKFGNEIHYLMMLKFESNLANFEQLNYLLSSFKYFLNQHLRFSLLESNYLKASEIQNSLIPKAIPEFKNFDIAALFIPAENVGGDVYDFIQFDDDLMGITIADASGHGLPAALQARDVIIGMRMGFEKEHKLWALINKLNKVIYHTSISSRFVSLFYAEIEKDGLMTYVNAGHCNPIYLHKKLVKEMDVGGMVLGWTDQASYKRGYQFLEVNSVLIFYTDGLIETRIGNDDEYGVKRLIEIVKMNMKYSSREIMDKIVQDVSGLKTQPEWEDDVSLIIIKRVQ